MEEPWGTLEKALMRRWDTLDEDERRAVIGWLVGYRPTACVRAMDYAQQLAEDVDETVRLS